MIGNKSKSRRQVLAVVAVAAIVAAVSAVKIYSDGVQETKRLTTKARLDEQVVVDPVACDHGLAELETLGILKSRPQPNRIDVDLVKWRALPTQNKRLIATAVRCSYLRGKMYRDGPMDYATVYGHGSDVLYATAVRVGVHIHGVDK